MSKPAHKQDDPSKKPGQIKNDVTLGDYIERKSKSMEKRIGIQSADPKNGFWKLTFDEWWNSNESKPFWDVDGQFAYGIWKAAQENK